MTASATQTKRQKRIRRRIVILVVFALVVALSWFAYTTITADLKEQGAVSVRNAILNSAKQCCAIEGAYPSSLSYLEQNYGLSINHQDYLITYEVFAENVMPTVVVLLR